MDWSRLPETILALAAFGYFYNLLNEWGDREGYNDLFIALSVAFGCLITILGAGHLIGIEAMLAVLLCFAASGISMIAGSLLRVWKRERAKREKEKAETEEGALREGRELLSQKELESEERADDE